MFTDTLNKIDCYVLTMESSYNNYVYYIDYKGQEYATISWRALFSCNTEICLTSGSSSLSMRSTQENFIVTPHIQGGTFSYGSLYSNWYPHYYGDYDVIYSPKNKIVKKGNFNVSTTASGGGFVHYIYGSQEFLVSQQFTDNINTAINPQIGNSVDLLVKVDRVKQLHFENSYPDDVCYTGGSKTLYFDFVALDYVKSISFTGTSDDYGSVVLNGVTLINQPAQYGNSYWNKYASGTIPVSYLKKNKNAITLSAYDGCWSGGYNNGTSARITLYFNY